MTRLNRRRRSIRSSETTGVSRGAVMLAMPGSTFGSARPDASHPPGASVVAGSGHERRPHPPPARTPAAPPSRRAPHRATIGPDDAGRRRRVELEGLELPEPAASVRLLVPWPGETFELPTWNGNEFLLADGRRPALRTFTPVHLDGHELTIDIVRHRGGAIADWSETRCPATRVRSRDPAAARPSTNQQTATCYSATRLPSRQSSNCSVSSRHRWRSTSISRSSIPTLAWCCPTTHPPP